MKLFLFFIMTSLFLFSCKVQNEKEKEIVIVGNVKSVPDGKVYLVEAHQWRTPLDSTSIKDGRFIFKIKTDSSFSPYMAGITYPDSSKWSKIGMLIFVNEFLTVPSTSKVKYNSVAAFYLENGITQIEEDPTKKDVDKPGLFIRIKAGKKRK